MKSGLLRRRFAAGTTATFVTVVIMRVGNDCGADGLQLRAPSPGQPSVPHSHWHAVKKETSRRFDVRTFPNNQPGGDTTALTQPQSEAQFSVIFDGGTLRAIPVATIQGIDLAFKRFNDACRGFELPRGYHVRKAVVAEALNVHPKLWDNDTDLIRDTAWSLLEARAGRLA